LSLIGSTVLPLDEVFNSCHPYQYSVIDMSEIYLFVPLKDIQGDEKDISSNQEIEFKFKLKLEF